MSKPVTNVEIEDVLSSIRRLVSSSDKSERGEPEETPDVSDKLVLTPSLRVDDETDAAPEADEAFENQDVTPEAANGDDVEELNADAAEVSAEDDAEGASDEAFLDMIAQTSATDDTLEVSADNTADDAEQATDTSDLVEDPLDALLAENDENSSDFAADDVLSDDEDAPAAELQDFSTSDEQESAQDGADMAETGHDAEAAADADDANENTLVRRAAEFEAIIAQKDDAWDPDGTTEDPNAGSSVGPLPWNDRDETDVAEEAADDDTTADLSEDDEDSAEDLSTDEDEAETADQDDMTPVEDADNDNAAPVRDNDLARVMAEVAREEADAIVEEEVAAELETLAGDGGAPKPVEMETVIVEDLDDTAEVLEDEPAPFVFRTQSTSRVFPSDPVASADDDPVQDMSGGSEAGDEATLDEDALRDMVSEIVRQELQGALGERITRNVRKLVRREIHRALASQELE